MRKKRLQGIAMAAVAAAIVGTLAGYAYSGEQTRQQGFSFGNELLQIQEDVEAMQHGFSSHILLLEEGSIGRGEFAGFAQSHFAGMEEIIGRYDRLEPPPAFAGSVEVFRLSTEAQLESDREYVLWIETGDESHRVRSDALIQDSFEYETAALGQFNRAKAGIVPGEGAT